MNGEDNVPKLKWSGPQPVHGPNFEKVGPTWIDQVKDCPGVYRLQSLTRLGARPRMIPRVCKRDRDGILYIGRSVNLKKRIKLLVKGLHKTARHTATRSYAYATALQHAYPTHKLVITWAVEANYKQVESSLIGDYIQEFGEAPPLNSTVRADRFASSGQYAAP